MTDLNSLTERQRYFEHALREARQVHSGKGRAAALRHDATNKTVEVGR